jgi:hypothetical protein
MKSRAKIQLSELEKELLSNTSWILTKNDILLKVRSLLAALADEQKKLLDGLSNFPTEITQSSPKISRGENYHGLPYLVLDHPRRFDRENILVIRTFFWWGNFFSTTVQLSGTPKTINESSIAASYTMLKENDYYLCTNDDPWEHHFEENNYTAIKMLSSMDFNKIIRNGQFIKIARKTELAHWDNAEELLLNNFRQLIQMLGPSY